MGKPQEIEADKDSAFMCINWLRSEGVKIYVTTSKNAVSYKERFHKTVNEKLRIIGSEQNSKDRCTRGETILYVIDLNIIVPNDFRQTFFHIQAAQTLMYNKTKLIRSNNSIRIGMILKLTLNIVKLYS